MAKNYGAIYTSQNDAIALEQRFYLAEETTRGVVAVPTGADFLYSLAGSVNFNVPFESSQHRSGRHHNSTIAQKSETTWSLGTYINIDTTLGAASDAEIDPAFRLLWKSVMGREVTGPLTYTSEDAPDTTFTIYEIGDVYSKQAPGAWADAANLTFPGDGNSQIEWSGTAKTSLYVGISRSTVDNNAGNTVTVETGDGERFPVGAQVMIIENDGTTRSADTPDGSPRTVTDQTGDVITLDGAALGAADGSGADIYLVYYEPESPVGIDDIQTGLVGSIDIAGYTTIDNCVRSATINMVNNNEVQNYCYGEEGLGGPLFTPGDRYTAELSIEINLNKEMVAYLNNIRDRAGDAITLILGDSAGRHMRIDMPKVIFPIPEVNVPETGTIPVTFTGNAYQSALNAADEVTVQFL